MPLKNDLILRAARGQAVERSPVWLMRQAGRILPEYRAVRAQMKGFKDLVKTPERAAEVTIQPVDLLGVDAAIIFSDILVVPEAMGLDYELVEKRGPIFEKTIETGADVDQMQVIEGPELQYVYDAIQLTKQGLEERVPLIGFAGAPWTILAYMVEGSGSKTFSQARRFLYQHAEIAHRLLDKITKSTINYLQAQIQAGADMVQIFDSWAGILTPAQYEEFSLPYIQRIASAIDNVPVTVFAKGAHFALASMEALSCRTVGLDWNMDIASAKALLPTKTLQGNLDPCALYADFESIRRSAHEMLEAFGTHPHIANLGHGVYPDTPADHVKCFIEAVKEYAVVKS